MLRLKQSDGSVEHPGASLEHCHKRGKTSLLDKWVLGQTLAFLNGHKMELSGLRAIGVNVSPFSLNDDAFLNELIVMIERNPEVRQKICLEVTKVGTIINPASVKAFLHLMRSLGVTVALDDFGAGFSNFQYVLDLQADVIKIDGSIAGQVRQSMEHRAVVNAIVNLANDLGCTTVAEWVEDEFTLDELRELGVDYVQGILISDSMPPGGFLGKKTTASLFEHRSP